MIARRHLLGLLGMVPFMGTPQRPDQAYDPPAGALAPSSQSGVFIGRRVVVFGSGTVFNGVFVYSPTPGLNNLVASIASAAGIDPYGNAYSAGVVSYGAAGTGVLAQLQAGGLTMIDSAAISWQIIASEISGVPYLVLGDTTTGNKIFFDQFGNLIAQHPGSHIPETWQIVPAGSLAAGFAIGSTPIRYRKEPDNTVRLAGIVNLTANQVSGVTIFSVAAAYIPAQNQFVVCANQLSGAVATQTVLTINTSGNVGILLNGSTGNTIALDNITYPLD